MRRKLLKSLKRDQKILSFISKLYPNRILKIFNYKVKIDRQKYVHMISKRFISTLLNLSNKQILSGINEINLRYKKN